MLIYLDQNYASRIAKYLLGQEGHDHFGALYKRLLARADTSDDIVPPSPFHVFELRGGYLTPPFQELFGALSKGHWVLGWEEVLTRQKAGAPLAPETLLTTSGSWEQAADVSGFAELLEVQLTGTLKERIRLAAATLCHRLSLPLSAGGDLPFVDTFANLLAFRSLNEARQPRSSDLADLVIAATVQPYAAIFATDRFVREALDRLGLGEGAYSGRKHDVTRLTATLS